MLKDQNIYVEDTYSDDSEMDSLNSTNNSANKNTSYNLMPPLLMDHLEYTFFIETSATQRNLLVLKPSEEISRYFHTDKARLTNGTIRPQKTVSTNGKLIFCASTGTPYKKPKKNYSSGILFNQLTQEEKNQLRQVADLEKITPSQWQINRSDQAREALFSNFLNQLGGEISDLGSSLQAAKTKIKKAEFYVEYQNSYEDAGSSIQEAINRAANYKIGNFVKSEEYGNGALFWHINRFARRKLKGIKLKSYLKGDWLRLEVQFDNPRTSPGLNYDEQLFELKNLAEQILQTVHSGLRLPKSHVCGRRLKAIISKIIRRSEHDNRIGLMIKSLIKNGTYTPKSHGKNRITRYQLNKLIESNVIEKIDEHVPKSAIRCPHDISYRLTLTALNELKV